MIFAKDCSNIKVAFRRTPITPLIGVKRTSKESQIYKNSLKYRKYRKEPHFMQDKNKPQPKAFRITEETAEKFRIISQELGANQQQAMAKLIEVYEMEKGKETIPEMRADIDTFEGYVRAALNMYMQALETNQNMRTLVRTEYDALLKSKDKIITELQERVDQAEQAATTALAAEENYKNAIEEADAKHEKLKKQLEEEQAAAEEKFTEYEQQYNSLKNMYEKLQTFDEENQSMLSSFMKENENLKNENQKMKEEQHSLEAKILELTHNNDIFVAELKREKEKAEENLEYYKKNLEMEHQLALHVKENEMKDQHKEEMDKVRAELDKYKELYYSSIIGKQS